MAMSLGRAGGREGLVSMASSSFRITLPLVAAHHPRWLLARQADGEVVLSHSPHRWRGMQRCQVLPAGCPVVFPREALPHLHLWTLQGHLLAPPMEELAQDDGGAHVLLCVSH